MTLIFLLKVYIVIKLNILSLQFKRLINLRKLIVSYTKLNLNLNLTKFAIDRS